MTRASNVIITILNVAFLVVSLLAISFTLWFHIGGNHDNLCNKTVQKPLLIVGSTLFVVSLIGFIGSCCKSSSFLWAYLALMFFLILGLICFTVFSIVITNKGVGHALSNKGFENAKLGDYSNWLRKYVVNRRNWDNIKSCLVKMDFCHQLETNKVHKDADFYLTNLSPTQAGCCKPPKDCGFELKNSTFWLMPKNSPAVDDSDCKTWSNVQTELCYECKSCKASMLYNIKNEWRTVAIINGIILVIVIIVYSIGCCALKNNRDGAFMKQKPHP
ncbi:scaffold/adaptor protein [Lithospermum erythrorhizon]|uniref:Scaffold/adaptor protein n=1 Tax=Lithospermum erythrorhizon TaxID=34254 RepID=A0AAV3RZF6_LITER